MDYLELVNNCDPSEPLLSSTKLGQQLNQILLCYVEPMDLLDLTQALNVEQLIPTEDGLARDYRGLAELMGFNSIQVETNFKRSQNPTRSLLDALISQNSAKNPVTLNYLIGLVEQLARFDVIDDLIPTLIRLATEFDQYSYHRMQKLVISDNNRSFHQEVVNDLDQLTVDDGPDGFLVTYDAFICHAPEVTDMKYAQQLKALLKSRNKLVVTADDLLPGQFEYDAFIRLIERSSKVIAILTPNFSRSKACEFQTKFANEVGLKSDCRKIIPVLFEACADSKLPSIIKVLTKIDMTATNSSSYQWNFERLVKSLSATLSSSNAQFFHQPSLINERTPQTPIVTVCDRDTQSTINDGPIVELLHSQDSSAISSSDVASNSKFGHQLMPTPPEERFNIAQQNNKLTTGRKWTQAFKRFITNGSTSAESRSPTNSSHALLISSNSSDFSHDDCGISR